MLNLSKALLRGCLNFVVIAAAYRGQGPGIETWWEQKLFAPNLSLLRYSHHGHWLGFSIFSSFQYNVPGITLILLSLPLESLALLYKFNNGFFSVSIHYPLSVGKQTYNRKLVFSGARGGKKASEKHQGWCYSRRLHSPKWVRDLRPLKLN